MEINGRHIKLDKSEILNGVCPLDRSWSVSMVRRYGPQLLSSSKRMADIARCPDVLRDAGYEVEIVENPPEGSLGIPEISAGETSNEG